MFDFVTFNYIEGGFWWLLAFAGLVGLLRLPQPFKRLGFYAMVVFFAFGLSDFVEVAIDAFWPQPSWLWWWKTINLAAIAFGVAWYVWLRKEHKARPESEIEQSDKP